MMEELGAGFYLAMHDLEIRGAGEVLGESQSGQMQEVGFNLYTEMLNAAVKSLKAGKEPDLSQPLAVNTEINLHAPALLPETYCSDIHERLVLYKRLANCETLDELELLQEELVDRFGLHARAGPGADRQPSAAHRGEAAGHRQGRCRARRASSCSSSRIRPSTRPASSSSSRPGAVSSCRARTGCGSRRSIRR